MEKNLTTGSVPKTMAYFALPYLLSYFLQTLYGMADLFIIGQFCGNDAGATTAVANGSQVMHMLTVILVGLAMGTTVVIGKAVGAKKLQDAQAAIGNTVTIFMIISVVLTVMLLIFINPIVAVMDTPKEAVKGITDYLIVCFIGIPFITAYNVISSIFRGLGDSKSPMYFIAVACGLNIALDYIFIGACGMGPLGAALGTTLAQTFSVIISFAAIKRMNTGLKLTRNDFVPRKNVLGEIVKIGLPVAVQDGCIQIAFIVITVIANNRGVNDAAAVGVVEKMISFIFIVPSSMLATVSALAAQNIGAGKHDRAEQILRYALGIIVVYGAIAIAVVEIFAPELVGLFSKNKVVVAMGVQYISSYIVDCVFAGIHFSFTGYFCAYGKSYIGFIHNMIAIVCARIPGSYLASVMYPDTLFPMGFAAPAGSFISIVICVGAFVWMKRRGTLYKANL